MFMDGSRGSLEQAYGQLNSRNSFIVVDGSYHRITDIVGEHFNFCVTTVDEFGRYHNYVMPGHTQVEFH